MITVADIMTPDPITVTPDTTLEEVIGLMKSHPCRHLLVMSQERLIGIITDRDVRLAMNSPMVLRFREDDQALLRGVTAAACMTPEPMTIESDETVVRAAQLMRRYNFSALPVIEAGRVVGIITVSDIVDSYIAQFAEEME